VIKILNQIIPLREDCNAEKVRTILKSLKITRKKINVNLKDREKLVPEDTE
jgi:hypothetical protein